MNHTKNYGLPQWELNDLIRMEDFNGAMNSIEGGIDGAKAAAKAGDAELQRQVNAANAKAEAAQAAAGGAYSPAFKPYAAGSFLGTGTDMHIDLGFRPSFVIISGVTECGSATSLNNFYVYSAITSGKTFTHRLVFDDTGFTLVAKMTDGYQYPNFTFNGRRYDYIAFR